MWLVGNLWTVFTIVYGFYVVSLRYIYLRLIAETGASTSLPVSDRGVKEARLSEEEVVPRRAMRVEEAEPRDVSRSRRSRHQQKKSWTRSSTSTISRVRLIFLYKSERVQSTCDDKVWMHNNLTKEVKIVAISSWRKIIFSLLICVWKLSTCFSVNEMRMYSLVRELK